ncbi:MAG: hypothetical protein K2H29_02890 [Oscillospiraceae bacterium]|nr:hypothetical protein [Oscillospiraceae bacterium]
MEYYENIISVKETYSVESADALLKNGWVLLCVSNPEPYLEIRYSLGWDKRKGEIPTEERDEEFLKLFQ